MVSKIVVQESRKFELVHLTCISLYLIHVIGKSMSRLSLCDNIIFSL